MKRLALLVCWLGMGSPICATPQYRDFKDTQGRTIRARVIKFDAHTEMVTIERDRKRTTKVPLHIFSEADPSYIQNREKPLAANPNETPDNAKSPNKILSKEHIKKVAEQYAEALENEDFETINSLFHSLDEDEARRLYRRRSNAMKDINLKDASDHLIYIFLGYYYGEFSGTAGWLQFTDEGKIKYCPILAPHPVEAAAETVGGMMKANKSSKGALRQQSLRQGVILLEELGIPTYELTSNRMEHR